MVFGDVVVVATIVGGPLKGFLIEEELELVDVDGWIVVLVVNRRGAIFARDEDDDEELELEDVGDVTASSGEGVVVVAAIVIAGGVMVIAYTGVEVLVVEQQLAAKPQLGSNKIPVIIIFLIILVIINIPLYIPL